MHGFFYYASGIREPHPKHDKLVAWGLGYAFDDNGDIARRGVNGAGPDGKHGVVFSRRGVGDLGYYKDKQTWRRIPPTLLGEGAPELWIGIDNRAAIKPDDLARPNLLRGHDVKLADGNTWHCPAAVAVDAEDVSGILPPRSNALPRRSSLGDDGRWRLGPLRDEYAGLWDVAQRYWHDFHIAQVDPDSDAIVFDFAGAHEGAVVRLSANYRVSAVECDLLGLLDETVLAAILQAAIDWPTYRRWLQKKSALAPAGSSSSVGLEV